MHRDKITVRQLMAIAFTGGAGVVLALLPDGSVLYGGAASWIAPLAACVPIGLLIWLFSKLMAACGPEEGLTHLFMRVLGTLPGKLVAGAYAGWYTFYAGVILRNSGERLMSTVYEGGQIGFFLVAMLILAVIGARGHIKALARSAEVFVLVLGLLFAIAFLFAIPNINVENLLPVTYLDTVPVLKTAVPVIHAVSLFAYLAFLAGGVERRSDTAAVAGRWIFALLVFVTLVLVSVIGTFGAELTGRIQYPFFAMIRNITILDIVERIEAEVVVVWVMTDFIFLSALLMAAGEILKTVWKRREGKPFVWLCASAALVGALLCAPDAAVLEAITGRLLPAVNLTLIFGGFILIYIVGRLRGRIIIPRRGEKKGKKSG